MKTKNARVSHSRPKNARGKNVPPESYCRLVATHNYRYIRYFRRLGAYACEMCQIAVYSDPAPVI